jgi:hypothetical protein
MIAATRICWTEQENEQLRSLLELGKSERAIAAELGRSLSSVKFRKRRLGLTGDAITWTNQEIDLLKRLYATPNISVAQVAEKLGKTKSAIKGKATKLGLKHSRNWQPTEIEALLNLAGTAPQKVIVSQYKKWASKNGYACRCRDSIVLKLKNLKARHRIDVSADWFSANDIAATLGCAKDTASHWLKDYYKELKPEPISNKAQGGLAVSRSRLRSFLLSHPEILDRYRLSIDFLFLLEILKSCDKKNADSL